MNRPRSTSAVVQDRRLVQTAVKGPTSDSPDAVFLPLEHDAASEFRRENTGVDFWCGTVNGCGRQLFIRIGDEKIPHFFHRGENETQCRLAQKSRGRLDIEAPIVWAELRRWRDSRGLPEGKVSFFDPIDRHDARYMHISGPPGTRDTRIVLGDVTIISVKEEAASAQGRGWDWFVDHRNTEVRRILDEQGVAYARIRFTPTKDSAIMQAFLATPDNLGDWGRVSRYVSAPNRAPRPPAPAQSTKAAPKPPPARVSAPLRAPRPPAPGYTWGPALVPAPRRSAAPPKTDPVQVRRVGEPYVFEDLRARVAQMQDVSGEPPRESAPLRKTPGQRGPKSARQNTAAVKVSTPRPQEQLPADLKEAIARLEEALILGNRRDRGRCARSLRELREAHKAVLSREDDRAIKALLSQAGMRG